MNTGDMTVVTGCLQGEMTGLIWVRRASSSYENDSRRLKQSLGNHVARWNLMFILEDFDLSWVIWDVKCCTHDWSEENFTQWLHQKATSRHKKGDTGFGSGFEVPFINLFIARYENNIGKLFPDATC